MSAVRKRLVASAATYGGRARVFAVLAMLPALTMALTATATARAAQAKPSDLAPTRVYVQADYALNRSAKAHQSAAQASIEAFTRQLGRECPKVAAGGPQDTEAEQIYEELVAAATGTVYHSDAAAIGRFANTVQGLRWSSARVTRTVHSYAARLRALAALGVPDVCADARAWVASHYTALPASTTAAVQRLKAGEMGAKEVPPGLLAPYERRDEAATVAATRRLEEGLQEVEATQGTGDISRLVGVIGLNP
jgi:hypothetical protein